MQVLDVYSIAVRELARIVETTLVVHEVLTYLHRLVCRIYEYHSNRVFFRRVDAQNKRIVHFYVCVLAVEVDTAFRTLNERTFTHVHKLNLMILICTQTY